MPWALGLGVSVVLTFFSFPPFPLGIVMLVGLVPLFLACDAALTPRQVFWRAWLYVFVGNAAICAWVATAVSEFSKVPSWVSWPSVLFLSSFEQIAWPLFFLCRFYLRRRFGFSPVFWSPACLVALDALWPKIFPNTMGYVFYSVPWLAQAADLFGVSGLTALIVATNEYLARTLSKGFLSRQERFYDGIAVGAFSLLLGGYGVWRQYDIHRIEPLRRFDVAIVQPNVNTFVKVKAAEDREGMRREVFLLHQKLSESALAAGPALVFWPETAFPAAYRWDSEGGLARELDQWSEALGVALLVGAPFEIEDKRYNGILFFEAGQKIPKAYAKRRLLELGETIPLAETFAFLQPLAKVLGTSRYRAGNEIIVFDWKEARLGPMVCLEGLYPGLVREIVKRGADVLVNATNDAWFGKAQEPYLHLELTAFRSIETRRPLIRATNTGISAVIGIDGTSRRRSELGDETVHLDSVPVYAPIGTPYLWWGNFWIWIAGGYAAGAFVWTRLRKNRS